MTLQGRATLRLSTPPRVFPAKISRMQQLNASPLPTCRTTIIYPRASVVLSGDVYSIPPREFFIQPRPSFLSFVDFILRQSSLRIDSVNFQGRLRKVTAANVTCASAISFLLISRNLTSRIIFGFSALASCLSPRHETVAVFLVFFFLEKNNRLFAALRPSNPNALYLL